MRKISKSVARKTLYESLINKIAKKVKRIVDEAYEDEDIDNDDVDDDDDFDNDTDENPEVQVGDTIRIISMKGEPQYDGREGVVELIDSIGQIHGTWGGCAIQPENDKFIVL